MRLMNRIKELSMNNTITFLALFPFIGALLAFVLGKQQAKLAFWTAEGVSALLFLATLWLAYQYSTPIRIDHTWLTFGTRSLPFGFYVDGLSIVMLLIATGLGFLDIHFAHDYMAEDKDQARYYAKVLFFIGGMILLVMAKDMIGLFVGWEFMGLASYLLISFWHSQKAPSDAGMQAFLYTRFGDMFIFAAIGLLLYFVGTLNLVEINTLAQAGGIDHSVAFIIALFIFIGAIGKSGQFPLFPWLMNAMEGPTTVSALIHGATMVNAGIYIVARLFDFYLSTEALLIVANIAAISAFIGATSALVQTEIKKVLAYSTMSHLALAFVGLGVGSLAAGMMHLVNHAVFKALLFLSAGAVILAAHHHKDLWQFGGLRGKLPFIAAFMAIGALSLSGIPPFSGFFSKDAVLTAALRNPETQGLIATLTTIAALLSIAYIGRVWLLLFSGEARDANLHQSIQRPSLFWIALPLLIMSVLTLMLGFYQSEIATFITGKTEASPHIDGLLTGLIIGLSILALIVVGLYAKDLTLVKKMAQHPFLSMLHQLLFHGYYVEAMINWFSQHAVVNGAAKASAWFDKRAIDASVNGFVPATQTAFNGLKTTQTGRIGDYIALMVAGLAVLLIVMMVGI
jgi:NADH-quinone oxidoreductase subunit L